jgi:hypothetical protein
MLGEVVYRGKHTKLVIHCVHAFFGSDLILCQFFLNYLCLYTIFSFSVIHGAR